MYDPGPSDETVEAIKSLLMKVHPEARRLILSQVVADLGITTNGERAQGWAITTLKESAASATLREAGEALVRAASLMAVPAGKEVET